MLAAPPKAVLVFAYLALHRDAPVARDAFAYLLWPDATESEARANLRRHLWHLTRALPATDTEPWIISDAKTTALSSSAAIWIDADEYDRCDETTAGKSAAVELYDGPLLETFDDEWIEPIRERFHNRQIANLFALAASAAGLNDLPAAIDLGRRVLRIDPWREDALRDIVRWRVAVGDRAGAIAEYREFASKLKADLGVEPMAESRRVFDEIASGDVPIASAPAVRASPHPSQEKPADDVSPPAAVPATFTSFLGRGDELEQLSAMLEHERCITLAGPGGVGKTRLAIALAEATTGRFADGVWFVDLSAIRESALVTRTVAAAVGLSLESGIDEQALIAFLNKRQALLVLDNCEALVDGCSHLIAAVLQHARDVRIVATSRTPIGVAGEALHPVAPLPVPPHGPLADSDALRYPSIALFAERATRVNPRFELDRRNIESVASICRRLDGIPLAIELAAARMNVLAAPQLEARLNDRFRLLVGPANSALPRQQTLRALIDWSYDLLSIDECRLFRRLSIFAGGWTLEAAEAVCADETLEQSEVLLLLTSLVEESMIQVESDGVAARYRFLETVREYAHERLQASHEYRTIVERHAVYFAEFSERLEPDLYTAAQDERLDELSLETENFRAVFARVSDPEIDQVFPLRLAGALTRFWLHVGPMEGRDHLFRVLHSQSSAVTPAMRAKALMGISLLSAQNRMTGGVLRSDTIDFGKRAIAAYRDLGDERNALFATSIVVNAAILDGERNDELYATLERALTDPAYGSDTWLLAHIYYSFARRSDTLGDPATAVTYLAKALAYAHETGECFMPTVISVHMGMLYLKLGDSAAARRVLVDNISYCNVRRFGRGLARIVELMAQIDVAEGNLEEAAFHIGAFSGLRDRLGLPAGTETTNRTITMRARDELGRVAFDEKFTQGYTYSGSGWIERLLTNRAETPPQAIRARV